MFVIHELANWSRKIVRESRKKNDPHATTYQMDKIELESNAKSRLNYLDSISHTLSRMNKLIVDCWMNFLSFEWKRSCCKLSEWMFSSVLYEINSYVYEIAATLLWVHLVGVCFFFFRRSFVYRSVYIDFMAKPVSAIEPEYLGNFSWLKIFILF